MSILNGTWWGFFWFSTIIEWISLVPPLPPHGLVGVSKTWFKSGLTFKSELNEYELNSLYSGLFRYELFIDSKISLKMAEYFWIYFLHAFQVTSGLRNSSNHYDCWNPLFLKVNFQKSVTTAAWCTFCFQEDYSPIDRFMDQSMSVFSILEVNMVGWCIDLVAVL